LVLEKVSPDGLFAKTAPTFSDMANFALEKVSPRGLLARTAANFADTPEYTLEAPSRLAMSGVPLPRLLPLLLLRMQKKIKAAMAKKAIAPNTPPTTTPGATSLLLSGWPSAECPAPWPWPSPSCAAVGVTTIADVIEVG
jgi:hypothetical protein